MEAFEGFEFVPTLISIIVVLAVLGATLVALRWASSFRFGGGRDRRGHRLVDIVERHAVGRSGAIVVMRYGGREHVIGVTESSITHLAEAAASGITNPDMTALAPTQDTMVQVSEPQDTATPIDLRDATAPIPQDVDGPAAEIPATVVPSTSNLLDRLRAKTVRH